MKLLRIMVWAFGLLLLSACDGDSKSTDRSIPTAPPPSLTPASTIPSASPSLSTTGCPLPSSACAQASSINTWLTAGDVESVARATQTHNFICPASRPSGAGGPFPLCAGADPGEGRSGVGVARRYSEGGVVSIDGYHESLRGFMAAIESTASDPNGRGALRLVGVSCVDGAQVPMNCTRSIAIFSAILRQTSLSGIWGVAGGRELLLFYMDTASAETSTPIQEVWTGIVQAPEASTIFETGGTVFDLGRVFILK